MLKVVTAFVMLGLAATSGMAAGDTPATPDSGFLGGDLAGQVGVLGLYAAEYEGSGQYSLGPVPLVDLTWRERVFLSTRDGLGAYAISTGGLRIGGAVNYGFGRDGDDVGLGNGIGDVDGGMAGSLIAKWNNGPLFVGSSISHQFAGDDTGFLFTLSAGGVLPLSEDIFLIGSASVQGADNQYMDAYFSLSGNDATASGREKFDASPGLKSAGISAGIGYNVFDNWSIVTTASYTRLLGDAADSPLVESENQFTIGMGVSFRLGPPPGSMP